MLGLILICSTTNYVHQTNAVELQDLKDQVREIVERYFAGADTTHRVIYAHRISEPLSGLVSPIRANDLIRALPSLCENLVEAVNFHVRRIPQAHPRAGELAHEGYDICSDRIAALVSRASRFKRSESDRALAIQQCDLIIDAAKNALRERLLATAGSDLVDRRFDELREGWIRRIDSPFHSVIGAPLSAEDLATLIATIHGKGRDFVPIVLTRDDVSNPARLKQLGVEQLLLDVREASYQVTRLSYKGHPDHTGRHRDWVAKVDALVAGSRNADARRHSAEKKSQPLAETSPQAHPRDTMSPPALDRAQTGERPPQTSQAPASTQTRPEMMPDNLSGWVLCLGILALTAIVVVLIWRSRAAA